MSWNKNDYLNYYEGLAADAGCGSYNEDPGCEGCGDCELCEARKREEAAEAATWRMVDHVTGYCSHAAAIEGGARYEAECTASFRLALPAPAPAIAAPFTIAIGGWLTAVAPRMTAPRYAAIGNGLFVRTGNGKRRAA